MNLRDICTFLIPVRMDGDERQRNLDFVLQWLAPLTARIIVLEADDSPKVGKGCIPDNVEYVFVKDSNPVFHRTHYINMLLKSAKTDIVSVWDADIVTSYSQIEEAVSNIRSGCTIAYPYNGEFVMLQSKDTEDFVRMKSLNDLARKQLKPVFNRPFCGGAFFADKTAYLSLGGENERFTGWGPEDAERLRRVQIMGHQVRWTTDGAAYHLYHPRKSNSRFSDTEASILMRQELIKVCSMSKEELAQYIITFSNLQR